MLSAIFLLLLVCLASRVSSHSFMVQPDAYNRVFLTKSCQGSECQQACPNDLSDSSMNNTPEKPAAVWKRGQKVSVKWAKNNHRGGLVRMSIVPVDKKMSREWHKRLALWYGCWESGLYKCSGSLCGTDSNGEGFQRDVTIPNVFPDGVYVVGILWYGGLHYTREKGDFPDYYSCSYVRIEGGTPLGGSYQPIWKAGDMGEFEGASYTGNPANAGKCQTAADEPGECSHSTGCTGPSFWAVSKPFQNGKTPEKIYPTTVSAAFNNPPTVPSGSENNEDSDAAVTPTASPTPVALTTPSPTASRTPVSLTTPSSTASPTPVSLTTPSPTVSPMPVTSTTPSPSSTPSVSPSVAVADDTDSLTPSRLETVSPSPAVTMTPSPSLAETMASSSLVASPTAEVPHESPMLEPATDAPFSQPNQRPSAVSVCMGMYCCPASCGSCGGHGCSERPGGFENCCVRSLKENDKDCDTNPPPCVLSKR